MSRVHDSLSSIDFEQYELIPRCDNLPVPRIDPPMVLCTHVLKKQTDHHQDESNASNNQEEDKGDDNNDNRKRDGIEMAMREKEERIEGLEGEIRRIREENRLERDANIVYDGVFKKIKGVIEMPQISIEGLADEIESQLFRLHEQIKELKHRQRTRQSEHEESSLTDKNNNNNNNGNNNNNNNSNNNNSNNKHKQDLPSTLLSLALKEKDETIRQLKDQLLESTKNNINSIFHTEITTEQFLNREIQELRNQIQSLKSPSAENTNNNSRCPHHDKITILIHNYEQMLQEYHRNDKIVHSLQEKHEEVYSYFSSLRAEIMHTLRKQCNGYSDGKLRMLEAKIERALDGLATPERVRVEGCAENRVSQLLDEIERLNRKIMQRDEQIYRLRERNQEDLSHRSWKNYQSHISKITELEEKLLASNRKIQKLEYTIIEKIETKRSIDPIYLSNHDLEINDVRVVKSYTSFNSEDSDIEKQKNNVRNLKTIVHGLRQENKRLKQAIKALEMGAGGVGGGGERVHIDESGVKLIEEILKVLVQANGEFCKCLHGVIDILLAFRDEIPDIEDILFRFGLIEQSSTIIPAHQAISAIE